MVDLKLMTVRALRELAKKHLGAGYSRLKTKAELMAALAKRLAELEADEKPPPKAGGAGKSRTPVQRASPPSAPAAPNPRPPRAPAPAAGPELASKPPSSGADGRPAGLADRPALPALASKVVAQPPLSASPAAVPPAPAAVEALEPESLATATSGQAGAAVTEAPPRPGAMGARPEAPKPPRVKSREEIELEEENLGELPMAYGDDAVVLLVRDPFTVWVTWDFSAQTVARAREGMSHARPVLRILDQGQVVREVEIALGARSWYVHSLAPGRRYRAELAFVDERGRARRVVAPTPPIDVPPSGPSPVVDDRFVRIPPAVPMSRAPELVREAVVGTPFPAASSEMLWQEAEAGLRGEPPTREAAEGARKGGPASVTLRSFQAGSESRWVRETHGGPESEGRSRFGGRWTSSWPS